MNGERKLPSISGSFDWSNGTAGPQFLAPMQKSQAHPANCRTAWSVGIPGKAGLKMQKLFCRAPVVVSVLALLFATSGAKAACWVPQRASKIVAIVPFAAQSLDEGSGQGTEREHHHSGSILGLWHVTYVNSDGSPFFESFKFWHPDGTEWESASVSPLDGNVCVGVWRETRAGTIRLHHVAWSFTNGILTGSLTIDEVNTVAPDGRTYTGTNTNTFYDLNGNVLGQVKGTHTAKRITVDSTGAP